MNQHSYQVPPDSQAAQAARRYLALNKQWQPDQYRLEARGVAADGTDVIWAVFLDDELAEAPGAEKSVELRVDRKTGRILQELRFQ